VTTFVALLRGINVGGRNRLPMADLRGLVADLGFGDVSTYLQSGNVVFTGTGRPAAVGRAIEARISADLALTVPVVVRSATELADVVARCPFAGGSVDPKTVHITFAAAPPDPARLGRLAAGAPYGHDRYEVSGSEVFLLCPGGYGDTKLTNTFLERQLGVGATTRNWRTVTALAGLAGGAGGPVGR